MIDDVILYGTWRHLCKKYMLIPIVMNICDTKVRTNSQFISSSFSLQLCHFGLICASSVHHY